MKASSKLQFVQFLVVALAVHLLVILVIHQFNKEDTTTALHVSSTLNIDHLLASDALPDSPTKIDNPTIHDFNRPLKKSIKAVFPALNEAGKVQFEIHSSTARPFSLLFEDTHSNFTLSTQKGVVGQNIAPDQSGFTPNRAYALFSFTGDDYVKEGNAYSMHLELAVDYRTVGMRENSYVLIGSNEDLHEYTQQRLMTASIIFGGYLLLLLVSIIVFLQFRAPYMFITICLSLVMTMRFILLGEFPLFGALQTLPSPSMFLADYFLAVLIFLFAQILASALFHFNPNKRFVLVYSVFFVVIEMVSIVAGYQAVTLFMHALALGAIIYMASSKRSEYISYGLLIVITYSIFSASVAQQVLLYLGLASRGFSVALMFSNQLSALIYIASFLFAVIMTNALRLKDLERQQRTYERSILLRGISHDLKLPISVIKLNTQMRGAYPLSEEENRQVDASILQATSELEEMTANIHTYLHATSETAVQGTCLVLESLKQIANRYQYFGVERNIIFETRFDGQECEIPVIALNFDRMVSNLLDNAFKYMDGEGKVMLRYQWGKQLVICVEDTGIGIEENHLQHILDPFYRVDASRNSKGSGLGLSVVKAVTDNLEAELRIKSTLGEGTCVSITIPRSL